MMKLKYLVQRLFDSFYLCEGSAYGEESNVWQNELCTAVKFDSKDEALEVMYNEDEEFILHEVYVK